MQVLKIHDSTNYHSIFQSTSYMLVQKFIEAVEKFGPMTAIVDSPDGKTLRRTSFDELMRLSRQVAGYIQSKGIAPQSFITIELSSSAEFMAAEMGVWMARCGR